MEYWVLIGRLKPSCDVTPVNKNITGRNLNHVMSARHPWRETVRNCHIKRTVKRILIRFGSHGYSAIIHALRLCSHVRFVYTTATTVPSLARVYCN